MGSGDKLYTFSNSKDPEQGLVAIANISGDTKARSDKKSGKKKREIKVSINKKSGPSKKLLESYFPLPDEPSWETLQRALGMARGRVLEVSDNPKDRIRGTLEIDGFQYQFEDKRPRKWRKFVPLTRYQRNCREIQFTFWPTLTNRALEHLDKAVPPIIYISHLRKNVRQSGHIEIIGQLFEKNSDSFTLVFDSLLQGRKYFVRLHGSIVEDLNEQIHVEAQLQDGKILFTKHSRLKSLHY